MRAAGGPAPRATYRLQLHKGFRFADAAALAPYLGRLGISHAYLSPILRARAGSMHGYDVVEHAEIDPELGTRAEFAAMAERLRAHGIGIILDIVPNHMGVGGHENRYWLDVLEHGRESRFADWFDIDWQAPGLEGKVLAPFLGMPLGEALGSDVLALRQDAGKWALWVHDAHKLPISPGTQELAAAVVAGRAELAELVARQRWRLANASTADDSINYRRFFIVSDLAGIRVERDEVFAHVHQLTFELIAEGLVDGLRVDHIDGLYDPAGYCRKLRAKSPRPIYIVVEKILAEGEALPAGWEADGTTGYEFAALVVPMLVDAAGEAPLTAFCEGFTGNRTTPGDAERAGKARVMEHELASEVRALGRRLVRLAASLRPDGDLTRHGLTRALKALLAEMPVYRTYLGPDGGLAPEQQAVLERTLAKARAANRDIEPRAFDFLSEVLAGRLAAPQARELALRIQQFSGPVMAKGLEDTALYRSNRLIALNDVGERPEPFHRSVAAFHAANLERARRMPLSLLGSSTHDSKRGEDTRCRIAALSGHAAAWTAHVPEWRALLAAQGAPAIHPDDAYAFFQNLIGAWTGGDIADRLAGAMQKSLREARLRSNWIRPDAEYEAAVETFVRTALRPGADNRFLSSFAVFEGQIAAEGALNGLIETVLKLSVPGVPDIYQGAELWEQSLVDPDNRRPVDFSLRERLMAAAEEPLEQLFAHWRDGAVKQALMARLLAARRAHPALFAAGAYVPVAADERICAFERRHGGERLLVAVRLFPWRKDGPAGIAVPGDAAWRDLLGPDGAADGRFGTLPLLVYGSF